MAWSTTDIHVNDVIYQDGVFAYNFTASGQVRKGQAVWVCKDNSVSACGAPANESNSIGVACYDAANGVQVAVAGPGNIVQACMDAKGTAVGTAVYGDTDGMFDETIGNATKVGGYIVALVVPSGTTGCTYHPTRLLLV